MLDLRLDHGALGLLLQVLQLRDHQRVRVERRAAGPATRPGRRRRAATPPRA